MKGIFILSALISGLLGTSAFAETNNGSHGQQSHDSVSDPSIVVVLATLAKYRARLK